MSSEEDDPDGADSCTSEGKRASRSVTTVSRRDLLTTTAVGVTALSVGVGAGSDRVAAAGPGEREWAFETGGDVYSSPTVANETVYVGSFDNTLYAVDTVTGEQQWAFETAGRVWSSPTVSGDTVYVGSDDNSGEYENLYAVNTETGESQWRTTVDGGIISSPTVRAGTVYVGSESNTLYAVDTETGERQWTFETDGAVGSSPTVTGGTVYVGSGDNSLYAVDAETGEEEWTFDTGGFVYSSPTVADGTVYVGNGAFGAPAGSLYAVDATTGDQRWTFETDDDACWSPTVADDTVFVGTTGSFGEGVEYGTTGRLYAVDTTDGEQAWAFEVDKPLFVPMVADRTVYIGCANGKLYALNAETGYGGSELWTYETGDAVSSSPTVADGTVYVGSDDGNLYAIGTDHTKSGSGSRARLETLGYHVQSPTAQFSVAPTQPVTGTTVTFDASNSSDESEIVNYEWDFTGDGTTDATGRQVTHTYDEEGTYTITLTVTDSDGATATTTQTVTVSAPEETEQDTDTSGSTTFSYTPSAPRVDTTVTFDANNFPSDATAASYEWDFDGDGTADAFGSTVRHIFSSGGTQTVTLTAELESGGTETARRSVLVNTPPEPAFTVSPSPAIIEEPTTFDAEETIDSTGSIRSYEWDFDGDGTVDKTGRAVTHTFSERGRPTVTLRATDSQGVTATQSRSITVQRAAEFSLQLRDTTITPDEQTTAAITVNSLLGSERLFTQLALDVPSGWDVSFVNASSSGGGTATEVFETQAGQTRTIRARISPNDTGEFTVGGRAFYFVGDRNPPRHTRQLSSGTLTVTDGETATSESTSTPTEEPTPTPTETSTGTPGFGLGAGATALGAGLGLLRSLDLLDSDRSESDDHRSESGNHRSESDD
jgi:outer membrane protein assembly factor BamB